MGNKSLVFYFLLSDGFLLLSDYSLIIVLNIYRALALGQAFHLIISWKPNHSPLSRHFGFVSQFTDEENLEFKVTKVEH